MISLLDQPKFYQLFDAAAIAVSATFFFNPVVGASCALTHLALERLANGPDYDRPFLPLNQKTITDFTKVWKTHAFNFFRTQTLIGIAFWVLGIAIPQVAILYLKASLASVAAAAMAIGRIVILAPLVEETLFRGFFQRSLRNVQILTFGAKNSDGDIQQILRVVLQAIAFGLAHYNKAHKAMNGVIIASAGLIGFCAGCFQEVDEGALASSISFHSMVNTSVTYRVMAFGA